MTALRQLVLPFPHAPHYAAADFCAAPCNAEALAWLDRTENWPQHRLALWGEEGSGKTHLLHLWAGRHGAALLPAPSLRGLPPLPARGVALDDADAAADETALFHLLNAATEAGVPVLLAGRTPPARWNIHLPDLSSRLRAITAIGIGQPDDALLRALLLRLLSERQLAVPESVQNWLLLRLPRTPAAIREAAARLDRATLATGGKADRALAAHVLAEMAGFDDNSAADGSSASLSGPGLF